MLKSAVVLFSGNSFFYLMLFVRNLIVARMISVENYGIASTFAISMAIVEMMSTLGLPQIIIQDEDGNNPKLQSSLQGFNLLRSMFSATALLIIAQPLANFMGIPDLAWTYQLLACLPVIGGLIHFDIYRLQRSMKFTPSILTNLIPTVISVLALWPLHHYYGDYRVMLYSLLIQHALTTVVSHFVAERSFKMTFDKHVMKRAFRFGWPIMLGGGVLFIVFNGEKMIVGRELGLETLALFSMGFTLTLTPTLVLESSIQSFFFPQLSNNQSRDTQFHSLSMTIIQSYLLVSLTFLLGVLMLGGPLVQLLLGSKYGALIPILPWLAILQALRMLKAGGNAISLSKAQTENSMIAGLARIVAIPFAWYAIIVTGDLLPLIWIATIGELAGFAISLILIKWRLRVSLNPVYFPILVTLLCMALVGLYTSLTYTSIPAPNSQFMTMLCIIGVFILAPFTMKNLRRYVAEKGQV